MTLAAGPDLLAELAQLRQQTELEHVVDPRSRLTLELGQLVEVPRVDHQGLLADGVGADPERQAGVGIVQVVGAADRDVVDPLGVAPALELLEVAVEALHLREEAGVEEVAVEDPHRVVRIARRREPVAGVGDRLEMTGGDVTRDAEEGKVAGGGLLLGLGHVLQDSGSTPRAPPFALPDRDDPSWNPGPSAGIRRHLWPEVRPARESR